MIQKNQRYINREISWLSFNHRVLQEADDQHVPIIERMRFLGIFSNNLDEFFKVRVATIKRMIQLKINPLKKEKLKPKDVMHQIQEKVLELQDQFGIIYEKNLKELRKEGIIIIDESKLDIHQADFARHYFHDKVLHLLTVIMVKGLPEFPYLKDKSIYLFVKMWCDKETDNDYALIEIPSSLSRFIELPTKENKRYLILLDDIIRLCLPQIFSIFKFKSFQAFTVKITRDAELDIDNDLSASFLEKISKGIRKRSSGQPVRLLYDQDMPDDLLNFILNKLKLTKEDTTIAGSRYHNFKDFIKFPNMGRKDLENEILPPVTHHRFKSDKNYLDIIAQKDVLLHFPFHDFRQYISLLREASIDPKVKSIKSTIYRVTDDSKIVKALKNAARNGKNVTVNIELQARFDEANNIKFAEELQEVGAKVLFGVNRLKVHSKLALITRKEGNSYVDYASVGTGNFHEGTAKIYTDTMLLTCDKRITADVHKVFDYFENTYQNYTFRHLLVSPLNQRRWLVKMIDEEIKNSKNGKPAYITLKINSLVDTDMIEKLYSASNAGVKIHIIIRGICMLIPGIKGMSENITAVSIVDRMLEHSRIFVFCNNDDPLYYISSADWMTRNLDHRIEVSCPILDPDIKKEIQDHLNLLFADNLKSRIIDAEQSNTYKAKKLNEKDIRSQIELYKYYFYRDGIEK